MGERAGRDEGRLPGTAVDVAPVTRPGVPREREVGDTGAWWERPDPQPLADLLSREGVRRATPVFGTAQPARGLSGLFRRAAHRMPERRASRWALLFVADRVDVLEHRVARGVWILPAAVALLVGYAAGARALERR